MWEFQSMSAHPARNLFAMIEVFKGGSDWLFVKLLDEVCERMRHRDDSLQTEKVCVYWAKAFAMWGSTRQLDPMSLNGRPTALQPMHESPFRVELHRR
jgi:hypothetical protein